jgi:hypothetical protein
MLALITTGIPLQIFDTPVMVGAGAAFTVTENPSDVAEHPMLSVIFTL